MSNIICSVNSVGVYLVFTSKSQKMEIPEHYYSHFPYKGEFLQQER